MNNRDNLQDQEDTLSDKSSHKSEPFINMFEPFDFRTENQKSKEAKDTLESTQMREFLTRNRQRGQHW